MALRKDCSKVRLIDLDYNLLETLEIGVRARNQPGSHFDRVRDHHIDACLVGRAVLAEVYRVLLHMFGKYRLETRLSILLIEYLAQLR